METYPHPFFHILTLPILFFIPSAYHTHSVLEHHPIYQKVAGLIPSQRTYLGCEFDPWPRQVPETTICFSLTLSHTPLINKHVLGWELFKKKRSNKIFLLLFQLLKGKIFIPLPQLLPDLTLFPRGILRILLPGILPPAGLLCSSLTLLSFPPESPCCTTAGSALLAQYGAVQRTAYKTTDDSPDSCLHFCFFNPGAFQNSSVCSPFSFDKGLLGNLISSHWHSARFHLNDSQNYIPCLYFWAPTPSTRISG